MSENKLNLSKTAISILEQRYLNKDEQGNIIETPEDMFRRVAKKIASIEHMYNPELSPCEDVSELEDEFYRIMAEMKFLPNSPTLMNAGVDDESSFAACFVLPIEDDIDSIFDSVKNAAKVNKSGGGTGFSFSSIRPKDSIVNSTKGVASGPVSFMKVFNEATEQIKQGSRRRGANMGMLDVSHPDIMEFIKCKNDKSQLNNFNISVSVTDDFMLAVNTNSNWDLINPQDGSIHSVVKAKDIMDSICEEAWHSGDPGVVFVDEVNRNNPLISTGKMNATNPCVTGDTWVMTVNGPRQVIDLVGKPTNVLVHGSPHTTGPNGFFSTGVKPVYRLKTKEGYSLKLTGDHKVLCSELITRNVITSKWLSANQLSHGDNIIIHNHRRNKLWDGYGNASQGYLIGLLLGDGTLKNDRAVISVWNTNKDDSEYSCKSIMDHAFECAKTLHHRSDFKGWQGVSGRNEFRMSLFAIKDIANKLGMNQGSKIISPDLEKCSSEFYSGFISGLFDADGSIQGSQDKGVSIRLSQSDIDTLEAVQRMLLRLGIASVIYKNRRLAGESLLPDGKGGKKLYKTKAQHELVISKNNLREFSEKIGFYDKTKQGKLNELIGNYVRNQNSERFLATFDSLEYLGEEEVFDVNVPGINAFDANGLYVHNCGEQPLYPNEACNLGSINVSNFYDEDSEHDDILWDDLEKTVELAVRFLDNVIDASGYPLDQINEKVKQSRKIGLGIMGFADLLYKIGIPYGSKESFELAKDIMMSIQTWANLESLKLGEEKGSYPLFEKSSEYKTNASKRNASCTTIAPTGTLSIIADCSSGIEPVFGLAFQRNIMGGQKFIDINKEVKRWALEKGFDLKSLEFDLMNKKIEEIDYIPQEMKKVFVTAHNVKPSDHLNMQSAFQKYVDNAISKTINLPNSATIEDIENIYLDAWKLKCKGVTVYRDGCKDDQVLSTFTEKKKVPEEIVKSNKIERPDVLNGTTTRIKTGMGHLYVTINETEDGIPLEVFATIGKSGKSTTAKTEAIGRLISLALKSGIEVSDIIRQIRGISGEHTIFQRGGMILSIPDAIGKILEDKYGRKPKKENDIFSAVNNACPECQGELSREEGCQKCYSCGFSKCG